MPRNRTRETMCLTCEQLVGVWQTPWNASHAMGPAVPKTARHKNPAGRLCPGGLMSINPNTIMDKVPA